jgi:hypothetical protein
MLSPLNGILSDISVHLTCCVACIISQLQLQRCAQAS